MLDEVFSVILPENERSQAVARRLGLTFLDQRVLSGFPGRPTASGGSAAGQWESRRADEHGTGLTPDRPGPLSPSRARAAGPLLQRRWSPPSTSTTSPVT